MWQKHYMVRTILPACLFATAFLPVRYCLPACALLPACLPVRYCLPACTLLPACLCAAACLPVRCCLPVRYCLPVFYHVRLGAPHHPDPSLPSARPLHHPAYYLLLPATACYYYLLLPATTCHYLPLHIYLLLSATT